MMYEASAVCPTANLGLFRTALLKYPYELSCWYIVAIKVKVTETILSPCMTHFTISLFRHCTIAPFHNFDISPFHYFDVLPFHHYKHTIIFVTFFCCQYYLLRVDKFSLFVSYSSYGEILYHFWLLHLY